ncbi:hypothetical protein BJX76DRAFT_326669 [Aspergillus varians]
MRVHFLFLVVACLYPALLAFVIRVPRVENGFLIARDETEASHNATIKNTTSNATDTGNSTESSPTPVPTLNSSSIDDEDGANSTAPGELPVKPTITPALGVGGFILLATGAILALIGVRNLWVQVFLSSAFLTSLGVTVLIVYVMNSPVRVAIQGAYLVAIFFTGITFGALAIVFKELAEGLGCLLGGFCTSMWLLSTKSGGLLTATDAKAGFIGAMSVAFYAVSFSHYTRPYGLIVSTSIAGGTAIALGIDCYSKAGLKEFWLYLWALNDDIFPLGTNTYPVTRYIKVELAVTVIVAVMGVISQLRLWKVVRERRAREEEKCREEQRRKDEAEAEAVKRLEEHNMKERMEWEVKYGDLGPSSESSSTIPEHAAGSHTYRTDDGELKEKDDALEKKSISDSVVSYRCSDCRAQGDEDASTESTRDATRYTACNETQHGTDNNTCAADAESPDGGYPKGLCGAAMVDDKSSDVTAIVGSETMSVYSKRLSMLSRKTSVKTTAKPVLESQEALVTPDDDATSTPGVADEVDNVDSDCHTIAATTEASQPRADNANCQVLTDESVSSAAKDETRQSTESHQLQKPLTKAVTPEECTSKSETSAMEQPSVEGSPQNEEVVKETSVQSHAGHLETPVESARSMEKDAQKETEQQPDMAMGITQSQQSEKAVSRGGEKDRPANKSTETDLAGEPEIKGKEREGAKPDKDSATESRDELSAKGVNKHPELSNTKKQEDAPLTEKTKTQKEEPQRLNAETVQRIPKHTSRIVVAHRMNEWAKHLANADIPEPEPICPFEEQQPDPAEQEEAAAPVKVTELLQTPLNAQPPPAVESRVAHGKEANECHLPHDSRTGSQKKKRSKSPRRLSGLSVGSSHSLSHLPPAVQPQLGNIATASSTTLLSHVAHVEQGCEEIEKAKPRWKGPAPLIAVREDMMRNRLSSISLPTDAYARHSTTAQSPTDFSQRYPSTFPIAEEDDDDIPLSKRRTMLHQQTSPISPISPTSPTSPTTTAPIPVPSRWSNSGVPSRANSPAVLAAWRESVREDLMEKRNPLKHQSTTPTGAGDRNASPFSQLGQRNVSSTSIGDKIAEGMQRGDMSELHREAMRRMQAQANKSVNRLV